MLPTCRSWLADHRTSGLFSKDLLRKSLKSSDLWDGPCHPHCGPHRPWGDARDTQALLGPWQEVRTPVLPTSVTFCGQRRRDGKPAVPLLELGLKESRPASLTV